MDAITRIGLRPVYRERSDLRHFVRRLIGAAMLPILLCEPYVRNVCQNKPEIPGQHRKIQEFVTYYLNTWASEAVWWCQFANDGPRTTNHAEGWHNRLSMVFDGVMHPPLGEFLTKMRQEHLVTTLEAEKLRHGQRLPSLRRVTTREAETRINEERSRLEQAMLSGIPLEQTAIDSYVCRQANHMAGNILFM